jgi:hypothetical protein
MQNDEDETIKRELCVPYYFGKYRRDVVSFQRRFHWFHWWVSVWEGEYVNVRDKEKKGFTVLCWKSCGSCRTVFCVIGFPVSLSFVSVCMKIQEVEERNAECKSFTGGSCKSSVRYWAPWSSIWLCLRSSSLIVLVKNMEVKKRYERVRAYLVISQRSS